ncbi:MAG: hypothetical protein FWE46_02705 [Coriobacteriia bacterium]|nr:hypothetical protein [Coriobacteriia bacterium]MCL2537360.1 hypothetical protein [Coriobacteriia bacterium]
MLKTQEQNRSLPWSKQPPLKKTQTLVTVAGLEHKVGATHLALSLALKASKRSLATGIILSPESFDALAQYYVISVREESCGQGKKVKRFASFAGLSIMSGVLPGDLEGFDLLVWDCGLLPHAHRRFASGDLCCLVSGGQPWELEPLSILLMNLSYAELEQYVICLRGARETDFEHIRSQMAGKVPCISIMHKPEWSEVELREDLTLILRLAGF